MRGIATCVFFLLSCVSDSVPVTDGGTNDTGIGLDVTTTPDSPSDAPPGTYCSTRPTATLCDDFDTLTQQKPEWSTSGTGLSFGPPFQSSPRSMRVLTTAQGYLSYVGAGTTSFTLEAHVSLAADGTSAANSPGLLELNGAAGTKLVLVIVPGTTDVRCACVGFGGVGGCVNTFTMSRDQMWRPVVLKIEQKSAGTYDLTCSVDGTDHGFKNATASSLGAMTVIAGVQGTSTVPVDVRFDNIAYTGK